MVFQTYVLDPRALQGSPSATSKHGPSNTTLPAASIRGPPFIRLVGTRRHPETPPQRDLALRASLTAVLEGLPTPLANKSPGLSDSGAGGEGWGTGQGPPSAVLPCIPSTWGSGTNKGPAPPPLRQYPHSTRSTVGAQLLTTAMIQEEMGSDLGGKSSLSVNNLKDMKH